MIAAVLPIDWASEVFAIGSAAIVAVLSLYVFHASRALLPSTWSRAVIAGLMPLLPAAGFESLTNGANLQYFLMFACFWALVWRPATWLGAAGSCVVVLATTLNSTIPVLLAPLGLWHVVRNRDARHRAVVTAFLVGMATQGFAVFSAVILGTDPTLAKYPVAWAESNPLLLPALYGLRVIEPMVVGDRLLDEAWRTFGWWFAYAASASIVTLIVIATRRSDRHRRVWVWVSLAYSFLFFLMPIAARGTSHLAPVGEQFTFAGSRYVLVPMWFLVSAVLLLLDPRPPPTPRAVVWARVSFVALMATVVAVNFSVVTPRSTGPRWSHELSSARERCIMIEKGTVRIPITPVFEPPGWSVTLNCDSIAS
jgi:hypothetical protein